MARVDYGEPLYLCGTCGRWIRTKAVRWPISWFHYVHADDSRYPCHAGRPWPNAQSRDFLLPLEWHKAKELRLYESHD